MSAASLRDEVARRSRDFAWDQWAQLGVSGQSPAVAESRAADPEALLLFTLEVARDDPRLFDETLDWLALNEQLVSVQRLRNLCLDQDDRDLVEATLQWVAQWRPRPRLTGKRHEQAHPTQARPLFHQLALPGQAVDPVFAKHGLLRSRLEPSGKSQRPDFRAPIALAFRLRRLLGLSVRAEVLRTLLTVDAPRISLGVFRASAGFTRQNVRESLHQLTGAGVVDATGVGSEQFFSARRSDWGQLLGTPELPRHADWIQVLGPLRRILRSLRSMQAQDASAYMQASDARQLIAELEQDLRFAGVDAGGGSAQGAEYWDEFVRIVRALLAKL